MDKTQIINSIKSYLGFKKDIDFADFLGINQSTLSSWHKRGSINYELIIEKCNNINANWLLTGKGEMLKDTDSKILKKDLKPVQSDLSNTNDVDYLKMIIEAQKQTIKAQEVALLSKETEIKERALIVDAVRRKLIDNFNLGSSISFEQNYIREIKEQEQELKK
jgi:hypothetical protein